jgi:hypothetical protein
VRLSLRVPIDREPGHVVGRPAVKHAEVRDPSLGTVGEVVWGRYDGDTMLLEVELDDRTLASRLAEERRPF